MASQVLPMSGVDKVSTFASSFADKVSGLASRVGELSSRAFHNGIVPFSRSVAGHTVTAAKFLGRNIVNIARHTYKYALLAAGAFATFAVAHPIIVGAGVALLALGAGILIGRQIYKA